MFANNGEIFPPCYQLIMVYRIKELSKVNIYYPVVSIIHHFQRFQNCLLCTPVWSESIAVVMELFFEYRSEYLCYCLLDKTVDYCRHPQVPYSSVWLRYLHSAYRLRLILSRPQLFPDVFAVFRKVRTEFFHGHSVYPPTDVAPATKWNVLQLIDCSALCSIPITGTSSLSDRKSTLQHFSLLRTERATFTALRSRIYNA